MSAEPFYYRIVPETQVPAEYRGLALLALALAERKLGLSGIRIQWIKPATKAEREQEDAFRKLMENMDRLAGRHVPEYIAPKVQEDIQGEFWGMVCPLFDPRLITLNATIPPENLPQIVGHECKHLADWRDTAGRGLWPQRNEWEAQAEAFGHELAREHG